MHIPQILEPPLGVDDREIDVEVPVLLLRLDDQVDDVIHRLFILGGLRGILGV